MIQVIHTSVPNSQQVQSSDVSRELGFFGRRLGAIRHECFTGSYINGGVLTEVRRSQSALYFSEYKRFPCSAIACGERVINFQM
jgi:hypothetical protein